MTVTAAVKIVRLPRVMLHKKRFPDHRIGESFLCTTKLENLDESSKTTSTPTLNKTELSEFFRRKNDTVRVLDAP